MSTPFIGEIRMFGGNFAPQGWALCDGQLLAINQNDALFSLFGTIYGGDGETTYGLPDLRGRLPIHRGMGPGMTNRPIGTRIGNETVTLTTNELPPHSHPYQASTDVANDPNPAGKVVARPNTVDLYQPENPDIDMAAGAIVATGGNQSHVNIQPFLCVNFIVALVGIYPSPD